VSELQLGGLVSAVSVVVALGALPVALLVDRWSRVRAIAIMGIAWSGATAACAFAPGYLALLAARMGIGVGQAGFGPAASALLGASFSAKRRATVLSIFQIGAPLGIITGAIIGSLASAHWFSVLRPGPGARRAHAFVETANRSTGIHRPRTQKVYSSPIVPLRSLSLGRGPSWPVPG
jgi:MFS family permease